MGANPRISAVINRRVLLAPALPIDKGKNDEADVKKLLPTLDIGSHINARTERQRPASPWLSASLYMRRTPAVKHPVMQAKTASDCQARLPRCCQGMGPGRRADPITSLIQSGAVST